MDMFRNKKYDEMFVCNANLWNIQSILPVDLNHILWYNISVWFFYDILLHG